MGQVITLACVLLVVAPIVGGLLQILFVLIHPAWIFLIVTVGFIAAYTIGEFIKNRRARVRARAMNH